MTWNKKRGAMRQGDVIRRRVHQQKGGAITIEGEIKKWEP